MKLKKYAYIETFGCQMNERDSEIIGQLLGRADYLPTRDLDQADLVVVNTCSIRAKAEQKVYSLLGRLKKYKQKKPSLIVTVAGCVAQQEGEKLPARMPQVDIVVGTQNIYQLPGLVREVEENKGPRVAIDLSKSFVIPRHLPSPLPDSPVFSPRERLFKKFVTIMQGCNNFCTYCVVPFTRGREVSRDPADILAEVRVLVDNGIREITLLGQNVNSYGLDKGNEHIRFPELLAAVAGTKGLKRLRFTTSNPKDLSDELIRCFIEINILCPHFHLPVQSGANRILKKMNRKYTIETYLERVAALRRARPDLALTTDIIVGFPGETDADFEATMELLEKVRYHGAFSFKYSDRPGARSAGFDNKVDEEVKGERLARLQARQNEISQEVNRRYVGSRMEVMIEGPGKGHRGQWSGRTGTNQIVNFPAPDQLPAPGEIRMVQIEEACLHSLRGKLL
ncbi:MAG: tRNA (N6-isopentenyl adenosine(37)-C2)-methylthiotransferase MiaB [Desulfobacterales bacterium]|nr:tRNA (N6-isopentenyl adenosine(37)-C2)-methylthiotransferase MiaB [Desulfobacterales bacterium]